MIDKNILIEKILLLLETNFSELSKAVIKALEYAHSDELEQESKYDTRKTEANYLALAQKVRLEQLKQEILSIKNLKLTKQYKHIQIGALFSLKLRHIVKYYFISPTKGIGKILIDKTEVNILSINSPISIEAIDLAQGDEFEVELPSGSLLYEVINIY